MRAIFQFLIAAWLCALVAAQTQDLKGTRAPSYILGPNDQITVDVVELPEFYGKTYRLDADGSVSLPLVGRVQAAGLTLSQFEADLRSRLTTQVKTPHLVTSVVETRSQPVSVMGAVNTPGTQQLMGNRTLFDVLALAGGVKPDAGDIIKVTRRADEGRLDLPGAAQDPATGRMTAEVNLRDVVDLKNPAVNIPVRPYDEISVTPAQLLYVVGNVKKPGAIALTRSHSISTLEALSMAEGLAPNAAAKSAKILRKGPGGGPIRERLPVNLKNILSGKDEDLQLQPNDILYVPDNSSRRFTVKAAETAVQTVSGIIIWRGI